MSNIDRAELVPELTVVAPAFNEAAVLPEFHRRVSGALDALGLSSEIIYINDGSGDATIDVLREIQGRDARVGVVDLSRNFGKEIAMAAGLDYARGQAVVVIDTDLQDPPELIVEMVPLWKAGYDVVYAQREAREGESWFKKATAHCFYRLIDQISHVAIPPDTGDFRLLSRRAVMALREFKEQHRFMKGLFSWIGFRQVAISYRRDARYAGETKWNYWKLWNFALEGITSFTTAPLRIATYIGLGTSALSFAYAVFVFWKAIVYGDPVRGYPSLMMVILFLGGVQLMTLGVIGEYVGRMSNETKQRPLYFTNTVSLGSASQPEQSARPGERSSDEA